MQISGQEYCKNCHKQTVHITTLDPKEPLRCSICKTVYGETHNHIPATEDIVTDCVICQVRIVQ